MISVLKSVVLNNQRYNADEYFLFEVIKSRYLVCKMRDYVVDRCLRYYLLNEDHSISTKTREIPIEDFDKITPFSELNRLRYTLDNYYQPEKKILPPERFMCPYCKRPYIDYRRKKALKIQSNRSKKTTMKCQNLLCDKHFTIEINDQGFVTKEINKIK